MSLAGGGQPVTAAAWRQLPSVYVRGREDPMPEAVAAGFLDQPIQVVELPTGHCPNWSRPDLVAQLLAERTRSIASNSHRPVPASTGASIREGAPFAHRPRATAPVWEGAPATGRRSLAQTTKLDREGLGRPRARFARAGAGAPWRSRSWWPGSRSEAQADARAHHGARRTRTVATISSGRSLAEG
jgi:hypothetical protein